MPKKAVRAATRMALLSKFQDEEAVIVEDLSLPEIRTRHMAEVLSNLNIYGASCLIGLGAKDIDDQKTIYKSARNLRNVEVRPASQFNTYEVLRPQCVLLTKNALEELCQNLQWKSGSEGGG